MKRHYSAETYLVIFCLIVSAVFSFKNLGNIYLNTDEAETAVLARNILKFGLPLAYDGKNLVQQNKIAPYKSEDSKIWIFHPWLQFYLVAFFFKIFGISTTIARLPFALLGWITVPVFYVFLKKHIQDKFIISCSLLLISFSIPYYLYIRQCRYFGLVILLTLLTLDAFLDFIGEGKGKIKFIIAPILLFYSNYAAFIALGLGIGVYSLIYPDKKQRKTIFSLMGIIVLFILPGAFYHEIWLRKETIESGEIFTAYNILKRSFRYGLNINDNFLPLLLLPALLLGVNKKERLVEEGTDRRISNNLILISMVCIGVLGFYTLSIHYSPRHIIQLLPFFLIFLSYLIKIIYYRGNKVLGGAVLCLLLSGNFIHTFSYKLYLLTIESKTFKTLFSNQSDVTHVEELGYLSWKNKRFSDVSWGISDYLYEITHDYDGPVEGIVKYLDQHAKQDEIVKITYGDIPVLFYLEDRLRVVSKVNFESDIIPDWWIFRGPKWQKIRLSGKYAGMLDSKHGKKQIDILGSKYERIEIEYPEIEWENLPDTHYHKYKTAKGENTVLYRKARR